MDQYGNINAMGGNIAGFEMGSGTHTLGSSVTYTGDDIDNFGITATSDIMSPVGVAFNFTLDSAYQNYKVVIYYYVVFIPSGSTGYVGTAKTYSATKAIGSLSTGRTTTDIKASTISYSNTSCSDALADGADPAQAVITAVEVFYTVDASYITYNKTQYDDDNEGVYIGVDGIGLGAGAFWVDRNGIFSLHSSNFMIGSESSDTEITTYIRFNNDGDEESTYIDDVHITTPTVNCTTLSSTTVMGGDVIIADEAITCGSTSINMNQGGTTISVTATVAQTTQYGNEIKLTLDQSISCSCSFVVAYTYGITGGNSAVDIITVPANTTSVTQTFDGGFWGVRSVYFPSTNSSTLTFSHKTSAAIEITGDLLPVEKTYALGDGDHLWRQLYATTSTINTSDRKMKHNIAEMKDDFCVEFIQNLKPVIYSLNGEDSLNYGFIAQDIEKVFTDMGVSVKDINLISKTKPDEPDNPDNHYGLAYAQLVAPLTKAVQYLIEEINNLKNKIECCK